MRKWLPKRPDCARPRESGMHGLEWVLRGGRVLTVHDLSPRGWRTAVDQGSVGAQPGRAWSTLVSDTPTDDFNDHVQLLHRCRSVETYMLAR